MRRVITAFVWSALILAAGVRPASACSCAPSQSPCAQLQSDRVIFVGTPTSVTRTSQVDGLPTIHFRFAVEERLGGEPAESIEIETATDTAACGFPFRVGAKYLVYAAKTSRGLFVSLCSRTGPLDDRRDDLEILRGTAAGRSQARLSGSVVSLRLLLDGFYMHHDLGPRLAGVPMTIRGGAQAYQTKTDDAGAFRLLGLEPGTYTVEPRLPAPYELLFGSPRPVTIDGCLGETTIFVAPIALKGQALTVSGQAVGKSVMLRAAQLDAANRVAFARTTLAFTDASGRWSFPGLPPGRYLLGVNTHDAPSSETPYPTMWYPNAERVADATVIEVRDDRPQSIDFRLPPPLTPVMIVGRVVDQNGEGLSGLFVEMHDDDDPHALESWKSSMGQAKTDRAGRFTIVGFAGRRYHVEATGLTSALVPVVMDASPNVTITIRRP